MIKTIFTTTVFLILCACSSAQDEKSSILTLPEGWKQETIDFPISFAPDIDLVGFEELRFAQTWSDSTAEDFWTYMFVWYVDAGAPMTQSKLTKYFNSYYDGLMNVNMKAKDGTVNPNNLDETISVIVKTEDGYKGSIRTYDRFFTKHYIILNIKINESFCDKMNKQIIRCELSLQPFDSEIWQKFQEIKLTTPCN